MNHIFKLEPVMQALVECTKSIKCHSERSEESLDFIELTEFKRSFANAQDDTYSSLINSD